jgi:hypothetical protein
MGVERRQVVTVRGRQMERGAVVRVLVEGRALPEDWRGWCGRLRARGWSLGVAEALGGAAGVEDAWRNARRGSVMGEPRIALGRLLRLVGARLVDVMVEDVASAQESAEVVW